MFGRKRIAELEEELRKKNIRIAELESDIRHNEMVLDRMNEAINAMPSDCIPSPHCKACEFVKEYYTYDYSPILATPITIRYACGKSECCPNFVQKRFEGKHS